jgi:hypothetical protein
MFIFAVVASYFMFRPSTRGGILAGLDEHETLETLFRNVDLRLLKAIEHQTKQFHQLQHIIKGQGNAHWYVAK